LDLAVSVRVLGELLSSLAREMALSLHGAVLFFLQERIDQIRIPRWKIFEYFLQVVLRQTLNDASADLHEKNGSLRLTTGSATPKARISDLKIHSDAFNIAHILGRYLTCRAVVVSEAKFRTIANKILDFELASFAAKADYIFIDEARKVSSSGTLTSFFCGMKYAVLSCEIPLETSEWLMSIGVIPITPSCSVLRLMGNQKERWGFLLSLANYNRVSGTWNPYVPHQFKVQNPRFLTETAREFLRVMREKELEAIIPPRTREEYRGLLTASCRKLKGESP